MTLQVGSARLLRWRLSAREALTLAIVFAGAWAGLAGRAASAEDHGKGDCPRVPQLVISDLYVPEAARVGDVFPARVHLTGRGLADAEFEVILEARRVADAAGNALTEKGQVVAKKRGKFTKPLADPHADIVEFEVDLRQMKGKAGDEKSPDVKGVWEFVARAPRLPGERFKGKEHVGPSARLLVHDSKPRILLAASGPTREFQFLRNLFTREEVADHFALATFLQSSG